MALLPVQAVSVPSLSPNFAAVSATDTIQGDTSTLFLYVENGSGASVTVTVTDPSRTRGGSTATNPSAVVAPTERRLIPIYPGYTDLATNLVTVSFSATTSISAFVLRAA